MEHDAASTAKDAFVTELANIQGHLQAREAEYQCLESEVLKMREELLTSKTLVQHRAADTALIATAHHSFVDEAADRDNHLAAKEDHRLAATEEELAHLRQVCTAAPCNCGLFHASTTLYVCLVGPQKLQSTRFGSLTYPGALAMPLFMMSSVHALLCTQEVEQLRMNVAKLMAGRNVATERLRSVEQELAAVKASTSPVQNIAGR